MGSLLNIKIGQKNWAARIFDTPPTHENKEKAVARVINFMQHNPVMHIDALNIIGRKLVNDPAQNLFWVKVLRTSTENRELGSLRRKLIMTAPRFGPLGQRTISRSLAPAKTQAAVPAKGVWIGSPDKQYAVRKGKSENDVLAKFYSLKQYPLRPGKSQDQVLATFLVVYAESEPPVA